MAANAAVNAPYGKYADLIPGAQPASPEGDSGRFAAGPEPALTTCRTVRRWRKPSESSDLGILVFHEDAKVDPIGGVIVPVVVPH